MPKEDFLDIEFGLSEKKLEQLDRALEASRKKLKKKGGAFDQDGSGAAIPSGENKTRIRGSSQTPVEFTGGMSKLDKKIEKRVAKLSEKVRKDVVKQVGQRDSGVIQGIFGDASASNLFAIGKNPVGFIQGAFQNLPFLGGAFALKQIVDQVVAEIIKIDAFFKKFIDTLDKRSNELVSRQVQASIDAGQTQVISTTRSGFSYARDANNTFETFNRDQANTEDDFKISNTSGVE